MTSRCDVPLLSPYLFRTSDFATANCTGSHAVRGNSLQKPLQIKPVLPINNQPRPLRARLV
jgi:hypothetical protein